MHRCLEISEIVALICEAFARSYNTCGWESSQNPAALAALARTCQGFHQHALDALWRSQTTLIPLIKCFPEDAWEDGFDISFRRPLVRKDWDRVNLYSYRIKALGFDSAVQTLVPLAIWQTLELSRPSDTSSLLPNLCRLSWREHSEIFPYIRMLLGSKITHLKIWLQGTETLRLSVLPLLNSVCPNLVNAEFSTDTSSTAAEDIISSAITQWNRLESLDVSSLTQLAMDHIASLPKLRHLHLRGDENTYYPRLLGTSATFPALQVLRLTGPNVPYCASLISTISPSRLRKVTITTPGRNTFNLWQRVFSALEPSRNTLSELNITERSRPIGGSEDEWTVGWECLKPLTALCCLKKVVIEPVGGLDIDDGQFKELVSSWPMLRYLELGLLYQWLRPSRITPVGLVALVEKCPNLYHLGLNINATQCPTQIPQSAPPNIRLKTMLVGFSSIRDPVRMAQFLRGIFPQLSATEPGFSRATPPVGLAPTINEDEEVWDVVSNVLCFMRDHPGKTLPPGLQ
ncbi:hypothetical protein BD779DRAFT_530477 [Infundibulicybe gibba]|nr:hypothetical protein BD779DRAFT_530477 [Infundibulicybe gibba]